MAESRRGGSNGVTESLVPPEPRCWPSVRAGGYGGFIAYARQASFAPGVRGGMPSVREECASSSIC